MAPCAPSGHYRATPIAHERLLSNNVKRKALVYDARDIYFPCEGERREGPWLPAPRSAQTRESRVPAFLFASCSTLKKLSACVQCVLEVNVDHDRAYTVVGRRLANLHTAGSAMAAIEEKKKKKKSKSDKKAKKQKNTTLALTPSPEPEAAAQREAATEEVTPPLGTEEATPPVGSPDPTAAPPSSAVLPHSPAWFRDATLAATEVTDTQCHGNLSKDVDLVLIHFPPGTDPDDLDGHEIDLPEDAGTAYPIGDSGVELVRDTAAVQTGLMVLGVQDGEVAAIDVAASFRLRSCLSDVEAEEEAMDDSLLDRALAVEDGGDQRGAGERGTGKKRKSRSVGEQARDAGAEKRRRKKEKKRRREET